MSSITKFQFRDDLLDAVSHDGQHGVTLASLCRVLRLDIEGQRQKVARLEWATTFKVKAVAEDGKLRELVCLDLQSVNGWLFTLQSKSLPADLREKLVTYQRECADVLANHFLGRRGAPENGIAESAAVLQQQAATLRDVPPMLAEVRKQIRLAGLVQGCSFARVEGAVRRAFKVTGYTHLAVANYGPALALIAPMTDKVFLLAGPKKRGAARVLRLVDRRQTEMPFQ